MTKIPFTTRVLLELIRERKPISLGELASRLFSNPHRIGQALTYLHGERLAENYRVGVWRARHVVIALHDALLAERQETR